MTAPTTRTKVLLATAVIACFTVFLPATDAFGSHGGSPYADMVDTNGVRMGRVTFSEVEGKMLVSIDLKLPPQFAGFRGAHLHRIGVCDPGAVDPATGARSPFSTSSGHLGSEDGHVHAVHDGDLPPLLVNRDGTVRMTVRTDHVSFARLFDADGTALVVHALADNLANIPSRYAPEGADATTKAAGDSGPRVVCGVLKR